MPQGLEHANHRKRVRTRFLNEGLDSFAEHEMLELLLFYAVARKDVNLLAHRLIDRFGSLADVLDAPYGELCKVPEMGENAAVLIKLITQLGRKYEESICRDIEIVNSIEDAATLLRPRFTGKTTEELWALCLDGKGKVLGVHLLASGSMNLTIVNNRKLIETAINSECSCIILAHNHPSGVAIPSCDDEQATRGFSAILAAMGVSLADHLIFARGEKDYVSMRDSGLLKG